MAVSKNLFNLGKAITFLIPFWWLGIKATEKPNTLNPINQTIKELATKAKLPPEK
jgi:hypothetical protein